MDKSITVVVFYESIEIKSIMEELFRGRDAKKIYYSNLKEDQKALLEFSRHPHSAFIFIYAFDDSTFATDLNKLLNSHEALSDIMKIPHLSVLFCHREHRKQAYSECTNERFYLYDTLNPIYDMNKVKLLLRRTSDTLLLKMKIRDLESQANESQQSISEVTSQLGNIEESLIDEQSIQGGLLDDLSRNLNELTKQQHKNDAKKQAIDNAKLAEGIDRFKQHNRSYFDSVRKQVNRAKPATKAVEPLVIVADDQKMMLKIITTILTPRGFRVETAVNGAEALMKAKALTPNAVLLDIDMPVLNGLDTLKEFKSTDHLKDVPIIMLTSNTDKSSFVECLSLGAVDYIVKPTNAETLLKKLLAVV